MSRSPKHLRLLLLLPLLGLSLWLVSILGGGGGPARSRAADADVPERSAAATLAAPESAAIEVPWVAPEREEVATETLEEETPLLAPSAGTWSLRGHVEDPSGRRVADAIVGLVAMEGDRPGSRGDRAGVRTDLEGEFSLDVPRWARATQALLMARSPGWQPHSEVVHLDEELVGAPRRLQLEVGNEISGRVVRNGVPVGGASISIDAAYGTGGVFDAFGEAWWGNGRLQEKHGGTQTAEDGSFVLRGLGAYAHRLQIDPPFGDVRSAINHVYSAPAPGYRVYDLVSSRLAISVRGPEGMVSGASVHVMSQGRGHELQSADEAVLIDVPPQEPISLITRHPRSRPVTVDLVSPGAGQTRSVVVALEIVERPSMTVHVPGATAAGIENIGLRIQSGPGGMDYELEVARGPGPDTFDVPLIPVDAGGYVLVLEPHGHGGVGSYVAPRTKPIELPAVGRVYVEFELELFGRCSVAVASSHEHDWSCTYRLKNALGESALERTFYHSVTTLDFGGAEGGAFEFEMDSSMFLRGHKGLSAEDVHHVARRCGVLPAGLYSLEVESEGHATWRGPVTINAGETTSVQVDLMPTGRS